MSKKVSIFQIVILVIFGAFLAIGVLYFAGVGTFGGNTESFGPVLIWGTLNERAFDAVIRELALEDDNFMQVRYVQKDERTYDQELAEAIASGVGPDVFLLSHDHIEQHRSKIRPISYEYITRRDFQDSFVEASELFLANEGILGIPIAVDPLVLYWNRDLLSTGGYAQPPSHWDEIFDIAENVTVRDAAGNIQRSAIAFGEYENVPHGKEILATLIMQAGGKITERDDRGQITSGLRASGTETEQPAQSALRFYTEFANPARVVYSWNRSRPSARMAFTSGELALFVGHASEYSLLQAQNPNLNFAVAPIPQVRDSARAVTFGRVYAFAIPLASRNPGGGRAVAAILASRQPSYDLSVALGMPSPRRDVLSEAPVDGPDAVFRDAAIISKAWVDPDPERTGDIFRDMIEGVTSGARSLPDAVLQADREMIELGRTN